MGSLFHIMQGGKNQFNCYDDIIHSAVIPGIYSQNNSTFKVAISPPYQNAKSGESGFDLKVADKNSSILNSGHC